MSTGRGLLKEFYVGFLLLLLSFLYLSHLTRASDHAPNEIDLTGTPDGQVRVIAKAEVQNG